LAQINCHILLDRLVKENYQVSLETSGSIDIADINPGVSIVMDVKTPSSNESDKNLYTKKEAVAQVILLSSFALFVTPKQFV
jgi:7-carboxy-7-deazaguanine synthase